MAAPILFHHLYDAFIEELAFSEPGTEFLTVLEAAAASLERQAVSGGTASASSIVDPDIADRVWERLCAHTLSYSHAGAHIRTSSAGGRRVAHATDALQADMLGLNLEAWNELNEESRRVLKCLGKAREAGATLSHLRAELQLGPGKQALQRVHHIAHMLDKRGLVVRSSVADGVCLHLPAYASRGQAKASDKERVDGPQQLHRLTALLQQIPGGMLRMCDAAPAMNWQQRDMLLPLQQSDQLDSFMASFSWEGRVGDQLAASEDAKGTTSGFVDLATVPNLFGFEHGDTFPRPVLASLLPTAICAGRRARYAAAGAAEEGLPDDEVNIEENDETLERQSEDEDGHGTEAEGASQRKSTVSVPAAGDARTALDAARSQFFKSSAVRAQYTVCWQLAEPLVSVPLLKRMAPHRLFERLALAESNTSTGPPMIRSFLTALNASTSLETLSPKWLQACVLDIPRAAYADAIVSHFLRRISAECVSDSSLSMDFFAGRSLPEREPFRAQLQRCVAADAPERPETSFELGIDAQIDRVVFLRDPVPTGAANLRLALGLRSRAVSKVESCSKSGAYEVVQRKIAKTTASLLAWPSRRQWGGSAAPGAERTHPAADPFHERWRRQFAEHMGLTGGSASSAPTRVSRDDIIAAASAAAACPHASAIPSGAALLSHASVTMATAAVPAAPSTAQPSHRFQAVARVLHGQVYPTTVAKQSGIITPVPGLYFKQSTADATRSARKRLLACAARRLRRYRHVASPSTCIPILLPEALSPQELLSFPLVSDDSVEGAAGASVGVEHTSEMLCDAMAPPQQEAASGTLNVRKRARVASSLPSEAPAAVLPADLSAGVTELVAAYGMDASEADIRAAEEACAARSERSRVANTDAYIAGDAGSDDAETTNTWRTDDDRHLIQLAVDQMAALEAQRESQYRQKLQSWSSAALVAQHSGKPRLPPVLAAPIRPERDQAFVWVAQQMGRSVHACKARISGHLARDQEMIDLERDLHDRARARLGITLFHGPIWDVRIREDAPRVDATWYRAGSAWPFVGAAAGSTVWHATTSGDRAHAALVNNALAYSATYASHLRAVTNGSAGADHLAAEMPRWAETWKRLGSAPALLAALLVTRNHGWLEKKSGSDTVGAFFAPKFLHGFAESLRSSTVTPARLRARKAISTRVRAALDAGDMAAQTLVRTGALEHVAIDGLCLSNWRTTIDGSSAAAANADTLLTVAEQQVHCVVRRAELAGRAAPSVQSASRRVAAAMCELTPLVLEAGTDLARKFGATIERLVVARGDDGLALADFHTVIPDDIDDSTATNDIAELVTHVQALCNKEAGPMFAALAVRDAIMRISQTTACKASPIRFIASAFGDIAVLQASAHLYCRENRRDGKASPMHVWANFHDGSVDEQCASSLLLYALHEVMRSPGIDEDSIIAESPGIAPGSVRVLLRALAHLGLINVRAFRFTAPPTAGKTLFSPATEPPVAITGAAFAAVACWLWRRQLPAQPGLSAPIERVDADATLDGPALAEIFGTCSADAIPVRDIVVRYYALPDCELRASMLFESLVDT